MIAITYGIEPYGGSAMGWASPQVIVSGVAGVALLAAFAVIESRVENPMFRLPLFKIRAFTAGSISTLLAGIARGGLMFMLIIWLQGIWLPEHGYSFAATPLWAGIYMLPLTFGFLVAGPVSGLLSDRYGSRPFATGGMLVQAGSFALLLFLPVDFSYLPFALLLVMNGLGAGAFASPNRAGVMNSLPPQHRGAGGGMNSTFQNSAQVLSIGIFFTLMIVGLSSTLPAALTHGLSAQGVPAGAVRRIAHLPPVSVLFAAFLGYNPMQHLIGAATLAKLPAAHVAALTGRRFFPQLISTPFRSGLRHAFAFAIAACVVAAGASWLRGGRYVYREPLEQAVPTPGARPGGAAASAAAAAADSTAVPEILI
jgi:MFS family permease